jgi:hypothetical protein
MIELQTSVKQYDTTRTRTPKPGYLNLSNICTVRVLKMNRYGHEPVWVMRELNTKCQLASKQLKNVYFMSSYFTASVFFFAFITKIIHRFYRYR